MTPTATDRSGDGAARWKTGAFLALALAAVAIFVLGWVARGFVAPWSHPEPSMVGELSAQGETSETMGRPAMHVRKVDRQLEARPYVGITYVPVNSLVASRYGLELDWGILITAVAEGGPAHRAGVRAGDVVLFLGEQALTPDVSFLDLLWHHRPGTTAKLVVWREGRHFTTEAVLGTQ